MKLRKPTVSVYTVIKYLLVLLCSILLNFTLPHREPLSFALLFGALLNGFDPFLLGGIYLLSSAVSLSAYASLSAAVQAAALILVFCIYRRFGRKVKWEAIVYAAAAQLPFIFLFPESGYAFLPFHVTLQKLVIAAFFFVASFLTGYALSALLKNAFRCRLSAGKLSAITLSGLFLGMGATAALGEIPYLFLALALTLFAVVLLKNAAAVPFAAVLALPLCVLKVSLVPLAEFTVLSSVALLFVPYGKPVSALALTAVFIAFSYFEGLYARSVVTIVFTLLSCIVPAVAICCVPESAYGKLKQLMLFYRESTLPRVAVNRNRRAVGEQLYEVSALFREIECAFHEADTPDDTTQRITEKLAETLCTACPRRRTCENENLHDSLEKLVTVGKAKGRVNLIDLPADVSEHCPNAAGMLFTLNKLLSDYRRYIAETDAAREGRRLLAEQAHGVSVILRDLALEQSEEYSFSHEEQSISSALAADGVLSSEIFLYGDGPDLCVNLTLPGATDGKRLVRIVSKALNVPLALSEKLPVTADRACFVLKRKPVFDASFGVASRSKDGESACGDTHSILKIDERRFLVALSDGMGSGEQARNISDKTLSLIESFYKAKMPSDTVLSTVNRLVALSSEETFSCLDIASVNLDTGCCDIVKIGSPVGFLLSGKELRILEGESLPIGMLEAVHPATNRVNLKANDFLIFMSDGVTSAFGSPTDLVSYLSRLDPVNPQALAEDILKKAVEGYGGKAADDMTVLTVKLTPAA